MRWKCSSALRPSRRASISAPAAGPLGYLAPLEAGVTVFRDVTERVRAEEALAQAFAQGRLEVMDTILHNIGNAITSVAIGIGTLKEELANNPLIERLAALSETVQEHAEDWGDYVQHDPQGQQVRPFLLALAADFVRAKSGIEPHG